MDPRTQSRVFEPFFTTKKLGEGTGLGLSTVYAMVLQCGGHVSVASRIGQGTTFKVYLPRVSAPGPIGDVVPPRASQRELAGLTVLLVEDDDEIREIIRETLAEQGCEVLEACNGITALDRCAGYGGSIHVLVTDVMMPEMNGHELAERVLQLRPDMPILFVSGHPEAEIGNHRLAGPNLSLLRKPFSSNQLVERVIHVVKSNARPSDPNHSAAAELSSPLSVR